MYELPIPLDDLKLCNTGLIQESNKRPKTLESKYDIGEYGDFMLMSKWAEERQHG